MIASGSLNRRITILGKTMIDDGREQVETFAPLFNTFASVQYLSDFEKFTAGAVQHNLSIRFVIRKREVSVNDRIQFEGKTYEIVGIKEVDRVFIEITAGKAIS